MRDRKIREAYASICKIYEDVKDIDDDRIIPLNDCCVKSKNQLLLLDWKEKYGIDLPYYYTPYIDDYVKINTHMSIVYFIDGYKSKNEGNGVYIFNSEKQPIDEWLLQTCFSGFSTEALTFGNDYSDELYKRFLKEIQSYNPDYEDSKNGCFYWKIENAATIYNKFSEILNKYFRLYKAESKKREIKRLKERLSKLEKED